MIKKPSRKSLREKRHKRIRRIISGTPDSPRLCVFKSNKYIYAQLIDDLAGATLAAASTKDKTVSADLKSGTNVEAAKAVGKAIALKGIEKGISTVVFDRGGYIYHGKVKALADSARETGLVF